MALGFGFGCMVGITGRIGGCSLEMVKGRLQTQTLSYQLYSGSTDCFIKITEKRIYICLL